jgi:predicted phage terminase large subunit-like protein
LSEINIAEKFEPLFELLDDSNYSDVDTVILTGGRGSTKSFNVALLSLIGCVKYSWKVLYSRFTNTSIGDSIKSEVSDKIELLGYEELLQDNVNNISCESSKGSISFKGIKTGSKGQTANLKSLSGFNCFIVDEAEEIPSFETFKKVYYSIRSVDKRNISILILNPALKNHWIFKKFFQERGVPAGFCGVKDNILYIHSSYLDIDPDYLPINIRKDYERLKISDPDEYNNIVLGGWINEKEGVLFSRKEMNFYNSKELDRTDSIGKMAFVDIADEGEDNHSVPIGEMIGNRIYIEDVLFTKLGTSVNVQLTANILNKHKPEFVRIESNFGGGMYKSLLEPLVNEDISLLGVRATTNKHSRIIQLSGFIKKHCYFRSDYEENSDYALFMDNIFEYTKDGEAEHDDAPDSIEGLCSMIRSFHPELFEAL